jgi:hypothetical protein
VCIAIVTSLSLLEIRTGEFIMVPIHYLLTAVVVMSLLSGGMLVYLRHYENIMAEVLRMRCRIKDPTKSERFKFNVKWTVDKKLKGRLRKKRR